MATTAAAEPATIPRLLCHAADRDPDGVWLRTDELTLTFAAAAGRVAGIADRLRHSGIRHGDAVLMTARNTPAYLLCWLASSTVGAVAATVNPHGTAAELAGLLRQVSPRALISDAGLRPTIAEAGHPGEALDVDELVAGAISDRPPSGVVEPDDLAALIPTSGTTGRVKLVMQTHRAYTMAGAGFPYWMALSAADRLMTSLPLFHINAPAYSVLGSLSCGAGLVLLPRFSAGGFLSAARRHGATEFNAIGAMLEILMRQPERGDDADTPLRLCYTGPAPSRERQHEMERRFGLRIVCGYAMSETPYGLIWPRGSRPFGTLGTPRQHPRLGTVNHAKVVGEDDRELGPGDTGELLLRNPAMTPGYWRMPDETRRAFANGWLRTGDLVTVDDDGVYTFVARKKEVLRRRGENLSPVEVEQALSEHPDVRECAVIGVPSDLSEDDIKAFVVPAPGRDPDFARMRAWLTTRLAAFKVPRFWQRIDELPLTATARVARHRLPTGRRPGEYDAEANRGRRDDDVAGPAAPGGAAS